jgi:membrane-associated phospholipid phosphatase
MTTVLVLRVVPVPPPPARVAAAALGGGFVLVIAVARLVQTVHSLTDVVVGGTTGLVVTLGAASRLRPGAGGLSFGRPSASSRSKDAPAPGGGQSRS